VLCLKGGKEAPTFSLSLHSWNLRSYHSGMWKSLVKDNATCSENSGFSPSTIEESSVSFPTLWHLALQTPP
jgi:hypothetical protein